MHTPPTQRTIAGTAVVSGFGYWSGRDVRVEFRPADPDSGIVFVRGDLEGTPAIKADIANRLDTPLRSSLRDGPGRVDMVEHVMAALGGLGIDNCQVWVDQAEMPGCDGSCLPFVEALDSVGTVPQDAPRRPWAVDRTVRLGTAQSWIEARPSLAGETLLECHLDYGLASAIGRQSYRLVLTPESFRRELAPCRTFVLKEEADRLLAQGLGRRVTARDLLVFDDSGPIENCLRFPEECVRHKMVDLVGDLALGGCALVGEFVAYRSGHRLNGELVRTFLCSGAIGRELGRCA